MLDILKKFDSVQSKNTALNEDMRAVTMECGDMAEGPAMQSPITLNITMSSADQMAQIMRALSSINGVDGQIDGLKTGGTPTDDPSIPGRDDVEGDTDLNQGMIGALAGGALGAGLGMATGQGAFGTTLGALSGAAAGDSLTDTDYDDPRIPGRDDVEGDQDLNQGTLGDLGTTVKHSVKGGLAGGGIGAALGGAAGAGIGALTGANPTQMAIQGAKLGGAAGATLGGLSGRSRATAKMTAQELQAGSKDDPSIPGRDDVEGDVDLQQDIASFLSAGGDLINKGASAIASSDLGQKAISGLGQLSQASSDALGDVGAKIGGAAADFAPDTVRSMAGDPSFLGIKPSDEILKIGAMGKGAEIGSKIGKVLPAAGIAGAGLAGASMLGGDNDEKQESHGDFENATTEPDEKYWDHDTMVNKLSGGINGKKRMYKPASQGDNAMAVESMKERLLKALDEAKKKPDANKNGIPDYAEDGKGPNDLAKGKASKKGKVPPQFQKNVKEAVNETADLNRMKQFLQRLNG